MHTHTYLMGPLVRRLVLGSALALGLAGFGCATQGPHAATVDDLNRTVNALRAENAANQRQVEELQNRIFILQDKLDSSQVVAERAHVPQMPSVVLHPDENAGRDPLNYPGDTEVEYAGEAATTSTSRPMLRLEGDETPRLPPREAAAPPPKRIAVAGELGQGRRDRDRDREAASVHAAAGAPAVMAVPKGRPLPPAAVAAAMPITVKPVADDGDAVAPSASDAGTVPKAARIVVVAAAAPSKTAPSHAAAPSKTTPAHAAAPAHEAHVEVAMATPPRTAAPSHPAPTRDEPPEAAAPAADPLKLYRQALDMLKSHRHAEAVASFREFVAKNPEHDYADNAQYWLGECFYDLKDYRSAVREFRAVVDKFPQGNKVPDALLKAGFSYLALGEAAAGRDVLAELVRSYPKHEAARLAEARLKSDDAAHVPAAAAAALPATAKPTEAR